MNFSTSYLIPIVFFVSTTLMAQELTGEEWPGWRGPHRDGSWNEKNIVSAFKEKQIDLKWRVPISAGYSGPSVAGGRVYITDRITDPVEKERVMCFDAQDGREIWTYSYECPYSGIGYPAGPRASVIVEENRAYTLGTMGHLYCFDTAKGSVLWRRALNDDYGLQLPTWGISAAPVIAGDKVIVQIGAPNNGCIMAFDKYNGEERWRNMDDPASYSAPMLIEQSGKQVVVVWTGDHVAGLNPETGQIFWQQEFKREKMVIGIATPVYHNGYIFVSSFYNGAMLIKVDPDRLTASTVWHRIGKNERITDALHCCISTPVLEGDHIYGVDSYGQLRCLQLQSGDRVWEDLSLVKPARWANVHLVRNGDHYFMFNEQGELIIGRLSPERFSEISRTQLIEPTLVQLNRSGEGVTWAHPAFAYGHVFIRNDKELVCADLRARE